MAERCAICSCLLHRSGEYARPTIAGRSHATKHHYVAERFFGRSKNRRGTARKGLLSVCPWGKEGEYGIFCYECHELLLHNPILLPEDVRLFSELVRHRGLQEERKPHNFTKIVGRITLFHDVISRGIASLYQDEIKRRPRDDNR